MKQFVLLLVLSLSLSTLAQTHEHQGEKCLFDHYYELDAANDEVRNDLFLAEQEIFKAAQEIKLQKTAVATYTIPVVVHIIYSSGADNISLRQIEDAIRVLNEDFRRLNADTTVTRAIWSGVTADMDIEFKLAKKDPSGNCTDGITRTQSNESLTGDEGSKLVKWNNERYLNIWVCRNVAGTLPGDPGGYTLGYAYFPRNNKGSGDGVILRHDEFGTIGTAVGNGSGGRTLTHEVGHYLALHHPFSGGCTGRPNSNPVGLLGNANQGDFCDDTPPVNEANNGCNFSVNTCSNDSPNLVDQIENYMDYTECQSMFSADQKARAHAVLTSSTLRATLVSFANATFTGLSNPPACTPQALLESETQVICVNDTLQFFDVSENGDPTSWLWSFPGGTPATSTLENPTVVYSSFGKFNVSLTVSNSAGSDIITYTDFVSVKNSSSPFFINTWVESFENGSIPAVVSSIDRGGDGNTFQHFANSGSHLTSSVVLNKINNSEGEIDELISPAISTANASDLNLFFDYAFAAQANDNSDELTVYVSRDCGQNWIRRRFYNSARLSSVANTNSNFVPANASDWKTETINFDAYIGPDPILIKFSFENGGGNNFYLDNIRFGEGQDVSLLEFGAAHLKMYPNPTQASLNIELTDLLDRKLELTISDISGKTVLNTLLNTEGSSLEYKLQLDLKAGVYMVRIAGENTQISQKLLVD